VNRASENTGNMSSSTFIIGHRTDNESSLYNFRAQNDEASQDSRDAIQRRMSGSFFARLRLSRIRKQSVRSGIGLYLLVRKVVPEVGIIEAGLFDWHMNKYPKLHFLPYRHSPRKTIFLEAFSGRTVCPKVSHL
jgi:hypothetical protein